MTAAKRKVSVSLDADLVDELETDVKALSKQVNDAVRDLTRIAAPYRNVRIIDIG